MNINDIFEMIATSMFKIILGVLKEYEGNYEYDQYSTFERMFRI